MFDRIEAYRKATGNKKPGVIEMLKYLDSCLCENSKMVEYDMMGDPQEARRVMKEILEAGKIPAKDCYMGSGALVINKKKSLQAMVQKILNDNLDGNYDPKSNRREKEAEFWRKSYNHLFPSSQPQEPSPAPAFTITPAQRELAVATLQRLHAPQTQYPAAEVPSRTNDPGVLPEDRISSELINLYGDEQFLQQTGGIVSYMRVAAEIQKRTSQRLTIPSLNTAVDELVRNGMLNPAVTLDSGYKLLMLKPVPLEPAGLKILDIARTSRTLTPESAASSLRWGVDKARDELEYLAYLGVAQKSEYGNRPASYTFPGL